MLRAAHLLSPLLLALPLLAQGHDCIRCKDQGQKLCKTHKRSVELERAVLQCSVLAECKTCAGAMFLDCERCAVPKLEQGIKARAAAAAAWLKDREAAVGKYLKPGKARVMHLKTAHFDLCFSLPSGRVGRPARRLDGHRYMHLYAERLENLYADFCKILELSDADFATRGEIYMFEEQRHHQAISPVKCDVGAGMGSGQKLMGKEMVFTMWRAPHVFKGDEELHRYLVHHVSHLLINHFKPHTWIYNKGHGWLDAGLAHWFEYRLTGVSSNYCHEEVLLKVGTGWEAGRYRYGVRKLLETGKLPPFAEVLGKHTDELSLQQHGLAFAYVDFIIGEFGGKQLRLILQAAKGGKVGAAALQGVLKINALQFDARFRAYVKKKYPRRAPRRRR